MAQNILITGGSGYLGGTLLNHLKDTSDLPAHGTIYALIRTEDQANKVNEHYNAVPLELDLSTESSITETLLATQISIVFFLIDAFKSDTQLLFIRALAEVQGKLGIQTHFLHTSGAKLFSSHAGHPTDRVVSDTDEGLFDIQKTSRATFPALQKAKAANSEIIEAAERHGVRSYIFIPCIVYGRGTGFGNPISIQTTAIIRAAKALRRMYKVDSGRATWPVSHVNDNTTLYTRLLRAILNHEDIPSNKQGYYLASSGSVAWEDLYSGIGKALAARGLVDDASVTQADDAALERMGEALDCDKPFVPVHLGGTCTLTADRGRSIGWKAEYPAQHILRDADAEVELVLANLE